MPDGKHEYPWDTVKRIRVLAEQKPRGPWGTDGQQAVEDLIGAYEAYIEIVSRWAGYYPGGDNDGRGSLHDSIIMPMELVRERKKLKKLNEYLEEILEAMCGGPVNMEATPSLMLAQARVLWDDFQGKKKEADILRRQRNYAEDKLKYHNLTVPSGSGISDDDPISWTPEWDMAKSKARFEGMAHRKTPEPPTVCQASRGDGECFDPLCPQILDGEPEKSGRHCPIDKEGD